MDTERAAEAVTTSGDDIDPPGIPGASAQGLPHQVDPRASCGRTTDPADVGADGTGPATEPSLRRH
eukprot:6187413-Pyramimonas_sp.AAC.1